MINSTMAEATMLEEELITAEEFLDRELGSMNGRNSAIHQPTHTVIPTPHTVIPTNHTPIEPTRNPRSKVLPRLLAMADSYLRAGSLHQALEMYFDLYRNHEDTPEAAKAEDRILDVARIHEENGELHFARAIYDQMI